MGGLFPFSSSTQSGRAPRIAHWGRSSSAAACPGALTIRPHPRVGPASDSPGRRALEDARARGCSVPTEGERTQGRGRRPPTARKSGLGRSSELTRRPADSRPAPNAGEAPPSPGPLAHWWRQRAYRRQRPPPESSLVSTHWPSGRPCICIFCGAKITLCSLVGWAVGEGWASARSALLFSCSPRSRSAGCAGLTWRAGVRTRSAAGLFL